MAEVIVRIAPDGSVSVEVKGVKGQGCQALSKVLEDALGTTTSDRKTADFYRQAEGRHVQRQ
ncbi:MAG: DUF2997 domain-containing protein [Nitrospirota bacterium]